MAHMNIVETAPKLMRYKSEIQSPCSLRGDSASILGEKSFDFKMKTVQYWQSPARFHDFPFQEKHSSYFGLYSRTLLYDVLRAIICYIFLYRYGWISFTNYFGKANYISDIWNIKVSTIIIFMGLLSYIIRAHVLFLIIPPSYYNLFYVYGILKIGFLGLSL
jgi:hypothetical protein